MTYEQMNFDDFDQNYVVLVHVKADGSAEVRVNVIGSTGNLQSHRTVAAALADANLRVADKINGLDKVCVSLENGATWDIAHGALAFPKEVELIAKPSK